MTINERYEEYYKSSTLVINNLDSLVSKQDKLLKLKDFEINTFRLENNSLKRDVENLSSINKSLSKDLKSVTIQNRTFKWIAIGAAVVGGYYIGRKK